ncbi:MAG: response regulator transcription factor [Gammaproteobacteria bacterium]|nr:response regulator transcription factor [Gammaproteobacteria bacterium]MDH5729826.1 response regulator transcription factor [Gammaproteobacteria bacterium]
MQTALVLEDHNVTRRWLQELLEQAFPEIQVSAVATMANARKAIANNRFNLAIIDINLPDGSGIDFIKEIHQQNNETYCVVATIYDDDDHLFSALQAGAQGYLLKEQAQSELLKRLQGIVNGEPPLSPAIARRVLRHFSQMAKQTSTSNPSEKIEVHNLTERETEVLTLLAKGLNRTEIGNLLGITSNTTAGYIKNIYQKLDVCSRAEATLQASRLGLVNRD